MGQARLAEGTLPTGARLVAAEYDLLNYTIVVDSPVSFKVTVNTFDYPGWRAEIDGQPAPITPTEPFGLIGLSVPAGQRRIEVRFSSTPLRSAATALSLLSTLVVAALSVVAIQRSASTSLSRSDIEGEQCPSPVFPWSTSLLKRRMK
jgi:hypothetical protein